MSSEKTPITNQDGMATFQQYHDPSEKYPDAPPQYPGEMTLSPITSAPVAGTGLAPIGVPAGLEYLTQIDQLLVQQMVSLVEAFVGLECKNKFGIKNSVGQQIYFAAEESGFWMRNCCKSGRGFVMHIADNNGQEVLRAHREFRCCVGCCWCIGSCPRCAFIVTVESPTAGVLGYVRQSCYGWVPVYEVLDEHLNPVLTIKGPCCIISCPCFDLDFHLYTPDGEKVGCITKQWSGIAKEVFTKAQNFGITFPMDLDVKTKGTLMGAVFLINMMFFERDDS